MGNNTICIIGTLDTKGPEFLYLKNRIEARGMNVLVVDCSVLGEPFFPADVSAESVAEAAGVLWDKLERNGNPGHAVMTMATGAAVVANQLFQSGKIQGIIAMGGGQGTCIGAAALRELPLGFPKVLISTIAMLDKAPFVGLRDTLIMDPVLDIAGMNGVLESVLENAAGAICGMVEHWKPITASQKPRVGITMFGVTTPCAERAAELLTEKGYEPLMFHANGMGGKALDELVNCGAINAVLDLTLTEIGQWHLGGLCAGTSERMEAALLHKLPVVAIPGAIDCVNFSMANDIPKQYQSGRLFHAHNSATTIMRTNIEENRAIGALLAQKLNKATGAVRVVLPLKGLSMYDREGAIFYDEKADNALFCELKKNLRSDIQIDEIDTHINDPETAKHAVHALMELFNA